MAFSLHYVFNQFSFFFKYSFSGHSERARLRISSNWRRACWNGGDWRRRNSIENYFKVTNQPGCCRKRQQRACTVVVQLYLLIVIQACTLEQITQASHSSLLDGTQGLSSVFVPGPACLVAPFLICSFGAAHWVEWMGRGGRRDFRITAIYPFPYRTTYYLYSLHDLILRTFKWQCTIKEMANWMTSLMLQIQGTTRRSMPGLSYQWSDHYWQ